MKIILSVAKYQPINQLKKTILEFRLSVSCGFSVGSISEDQKTWYKNLIDLQCFYWVRKNFFQSQIPTANFRILFCKHHVMCALTTLTWEFLFPFPFTSSEYIEHYEAKFVYTQEFQPFHQVQSIWTALFTNKNQSSVTIQYWYSPWKECIVKFERNLFDYESVFFSQLQNNFF